CFIFFFQAEDGIRDFHVTGVQTCALPIYRVAGLDTLWRAATFVESAVDHEERDGLFDVPHPPAWTLARRRANGSDAARLAQAALAENRREALLLTVYEGGFRAKQGGCAGQESAGWRHASRQGMFGSYGDLDEIAEDWLPGWRLCLARDARMRTVAWKERLAGR